MSGLWHNTSVAPTVVFPTQRLTQRRPSVASQLLEQQPFADADASYFEEEEYGTVSALLAEGAMPFLGLPSGPLQVGHFIGALGIVLMAFVEYPGFPLTNLPTPIRDALQGGTFMFCSALCCRVHVM